AQPTALRVLHLLLPAPDRGPDRQVRDPPATAAAETPFRRRPRARRAAAVRTGAREEDARRGRARDLGEPLPRRSCVAACLRSLGCDRRLRLPDLLRLQRLFGHGARARAHLRDRAPVELQPSVPGDESDRVLAAMARDALDLAA